MIRPLNKNEIKQLCSPNIFQRGLNYVKRGAVSKIEFVEYTDGTIGLEAEVKGSHIYNVDVYTDHAGEIDDVFCTCPAFADYVGPCKHIIATLLAYSETTDHSRRDDAPTPPSDEQNSANHSHFIIENELRRSQEITDEIIQHYGRDESNFNETIEDKEHLDMQVFLYMNEFTAPFSLRLKVGTARLYVVKNIRDFLDAYVEKRSLPFTSQFTYDPAVHELSESHQELLHYLYQIKNETDWHAQQVFWSGTSGKDKDRLSIPTHHSHQTLQLLSQLQNVFSVSRTRQEQKVTFVYDSFPTSFILGKDEGHYYLQAASQRKLDHIDGSAFVYDEPDFYHTNKELFESALFLHKHIQNSFDQLLYLSHDQVEQLAGTVFPVLERYQLLQIDESMDTSFETLPCEPHVYVDANDEQLLSHLYFDYGKDRIDPFVRRLHGEENMIVRDVEREQKVMALIEQAGFRWNGERLLLDGTDEIGHFFYRILPKLERHATVYMTEKADDLFEEAPSQPLFDLDLDPSQQWFEVNFDTSDISSEEILALMQSMKEKKTYHRTSQGKVIDLEKEDWKAAESFLLDADIRPEDLRLGTIQLPKFKALQLETGNQNMMKQSGALQDLIQSIREPEKTKIDAPQELQPILRDYQVQGFQWFKAMSHYGFGGILADDMGLGKTLQSLTYILSERREHPEAPPFLVVAPSSLIYNWEKEAQTFTPDLHVEVIAGTKKERRNQLQQLDGIDLCVTSYPLLRRDGELYEPHLFSGLLLDEAQTFKNHTSQTFRTVKSLRAVNRFALSGTPVENRAEELWALFAVVMPGMLPDMKQYKQMDPAFIQRKVSPFILRRTKKEVLTELPDKIETIRHTELTKDQRKLYLAYLEQIQGDTLRQLSEEGFQQNRMQILANITRLRQLCCHPSLFVEDYNGKSGKLEELRALLPEVREGNRRVLIFSQFTSMLQLIAETLGHEQMDYFYLDGNTPSRERLEMADRFNNGEAGIFLISLKAGGTGLNRSRHSDSL